MRNLFFMGQNGALMAEVNKLPPNRSVPSATVIPILPYPDVREAVDWLTRVFGFDERMQIAQHRAQMNIPGGGAMIVAEYIDSNRRPQPGADHISHQIMVRVVDVDSHFEHAQTQGAEILSPLTNHQFGERQYVARDLGGHRWTFSQTLKDMHPSEWADKDVILKVED